MKGLRMTPQLAVSLVPALFMPGGAVGAATGVAGLQGAISSAQTIDEIYKLVDEAPAQDLYKIPYYRTLVDDMGMDEESARREFGRTIRGYKPAMVFALGAVTSAFGPAGQLARTMRGGSASVTAAGRGRLARTGAAMGEGVVSEAIEEGAQDIAVQRAAIEGGLQQDFSYQRLIDATAEGALLGGVFGAGAGAVSRGQPQRTTRAPATREPHELPEQRELPPDTEATSETPNIAAGVATVQHPPAPDIAVGDAQNQPTRSDTRYPKAEEVKRTSKLKGKRKGAQTGTQTGAQTSIDTNSVEIAPGPLDSASTAALDAKKSPTDAVDIHSATVQPPPSSSPATLPEQVTPPAPEASAPTPAPTPVTTPQPVLAVDRVNPTVQEPTPTAPSVPTETAPVTPPPGAQRSGRILMAQDTESKTNALAQKRAQRANEKALQKAEREAARKAQGLPGRSHKGKAHDQKRAQDATRAREIVTAAWAEIPADARVPTTVAGRAALKARLDAMLAKAKEADIEIRSKVGYDTTDDYIVYLRDAQTFAGQLGKKSFVGKKATEWVTEFLVDERAAREGDFQQLRARRRAGGERSKRRDQGDVAVTPGDDSASNIADHLATHSPEDVLAARQERQEQQEQQEADGAAVTYGSEQEAYAAGRERTRPQPVKARETIERANNEDVEANTQEASAQEPEYTTPKPTKAPVVVSKRDRLKAAIAKKKTEKQEAERAPPTDAQRQAGNHRMDHHHVEGLAISVTHRKHEKRSGVSPSGQRWESRSPAPYGYFKRTEGADGEQVDVYLGPHIQSPQLKNLPVFVIDQHHLDGSGFNEHKVMFGFDNIEAAMQTYDQAFADGRGIERIGAIKEMTLPEFKVWLKGGRSGELTTQPVAPPAFPASFPASRAVVDRLVEAARNIITQVVETKRSVFGAVRRNDVGRITIDWGYAGDPDKDYAAGWGLAHIIARRLLQGYDGDQFVKTVLPEVLIKGRIVRQYDVNGRLRIEIEHNGAVAVVQTVREHKGELKPENWLLTAFYRYEKGGRQERQWRQGRRAGPGDRGRLTHAPDLRSTSSRHSDVDGAGPVANMGPKPPQSKSATDTDIDLTDEEIRAILRQARFQESQQLQQQRSPELDVPNWDGTAVYRAEESITVAEAIAGYAAPTRSAVEKFFIKRLLKLAGHIRVQIVTPEVMAKVSEPGINGYYDYPRNVIVVAEDVMYVDALLDRIPVFGITKGNDPVVWG
ncbi:MAG: hypothetical protein IT536_01490 [Hyphomicrobiales bacterium]|nr:hypothetical protein [Hyphomicrobiales bacterium]